MDAVGSRSSTGLVLALSAVLLVAGVLIGRSVAEPPPVSEPPPEPATPGQVSAPGQEPGLPRALVEARERLGGPVLIPAGTATIRGTVTTVDGRPLRGVLVRVVPSPDDDDPVEPGPPPEGDPLRPEIDGELRYAMRVRDGTREARSDAGGGFRFTGLGACRYRIRGYLEGWEVRKTLDRAVRSDREVRLVAHPVVLLEVSVRNPDGTPAPRARLNVKAIGRYVERNHTWTPDAPRIDLEPGPVKLRAFAQEGWTQRSDEVELWIEEGETPEPVVLDLRERAGIHGTLRFPPVGVSAHLSYRIVALRVRAGSDIDPDRLLRNRHHEASLYTWSPSRGTGRFCFLDLNPGQYLVGAVDGYREVLTSATVVLTEGMEEVELAAPWPDAGEAVMVRLLDPDGRPLIRHSGWVQARYEHPDGTSESGTRSERLGEGVWRVWTPKPQFRSFTRGGVYRIRANSSVYGEKTVTYDPGRGDEVVVRFEAPAELTVRLRDYAGSPYESASRLRVEPDLPGAGRHLGRREEKEPFPDGRTEFGPLAPGDWVVTLVVEVGGHVRDEVLRTRARLASGPRELTLDPPRLYVLTVQDELAGAIFQLEAVNRRHWRRARPHAAGGVRFDRVPAGDYVLWRYHRSGTSGMPIVVRGNLGTRFRGTELSALRVSIRDPEDPLAEAGLRDGDLVTTIGGEEIRNAAHGRALLSLHAQSGPVPLTVLRGGVTLEIRLPADAARDSHRAGGAFVPWVR